MSVVEMLLLDSHCEVIKNLMNIDFVCVDELVKYW